MHINMEAKKMPIRYKGRGFTRKEKDYFKKRANEARLKNNKSLCCNEELLGDGHCSKCQHFGME